MSTPVTRSATKSIEQDDDSFRLHVIEAFSDAAVAEALAKALQPQFGRLADKMLERIHTRLKAMLIELEKKDACIKSLQQTVAHMQMKIDEHEQYSRCEALRNAGLVPPQSDDDEELSTEGTSATENTDDMVLTFCNPVLALSPPLDISDIDRSHRSGDPSAGNVRPVLVPYQGQSHSRQKEAQDLQQGQSSPRIHQRGSHEAPGWTGLSSQAVQERKADFRYLDLGWFYQN